MKIEVDVHAHLIPVDPGAIAVIEGVSWDADAHAMLIDGHAVGLKRLFDPQALIAWMDENDVERALISIPPPAYRERLAAEASAKWCRYVNEGLRDIASRFTGRLFALTHLPIHLPALAAEIAAEDIAEGRGMFSAPSGGAGIEIASPDFDPLWSSLSNAKAFLFLHPGSCADGRLTSFYMANLIGNPHETGIAVGSLVLGGVVSRFPDITFCLAHGGGSAPMIAGRLQRGIDTGRPGIPPHVHSVADALPHFLADCLTHDESAVVLAESVFGRDNILFGSDWPFPMGLIEPHSQMSEWDAVRRQRIYGCSPLLPRLSDLLQER